MNNSKKSKTLVFNGYWTEKDVINFPNGLFVYGDNDVNFGKGGQAIIRDLNNTIGLPTKKYPTNNKNSFYTDNEYEENINKINKAIVNIIIRSKNYDYVIFPRDGFGTGLSKLPEKAPKTFKYICEQIEILKNNL
ncbi:hypothetical protein QJ854_gp407 [Moumouvirus goulette]|uniref:DUF7831 domain-containing protein n=1 Tax=Moumouvirus goulette TaxID=1247379 RepID=M1NMU8_9VIRU|nr:hypothetical protein QJ854_gp407 [Moumouvirus goulette]AGF85375.1 hypothetical protein glt_00566 [Moumouvirus goulette]